MCEPLLGKEEVVQKFRTTSESPVEQAYMNTIKEVNRSAKKDMRK